MDPTTPTQLAKAKAAGLRADSMRPDIGGDSHSLSLSCYGFAELSDNFRALRGSVNLVFRWHGKCRLHPKPLPDLSYILGGSWVAKLSCFFKKGQRLTQLALIGQ